MIVFSSQVVYHFLSSFFFIELGSERKKKMKKIFQERSTVLLFYLNVSVDGREA